MSLTNLALRCDLPTPEKLFLVYLAEQANSVGVGYFQNTELAKVLDYSERSIHRFVKELKDRHLLEIVGSWYVLRLPGVPELYQFTEHEFIELNGIQLTVPSYATPPPPDPVKESATYKQLIAAGFSEDKAYGLAQFDLDTPGEAEVKPTASLAKKTSYVITRSGTPGEVGSLNDFNKTTLYTYADNAYARFTAVANLLGTHTGDDGLMGDLFTWWQEMEAHENKNSVQGEAPAFELLYPAIVASARRLAGQIPLSQFLDPKAIADYRAPWDQQVTTPTTDATLNTEISLMLAELEASGNANCQVNPRTVEKNENGATHTESVASYHKRVLAKYNQMLKLKAMGAL